jgi:predicted exporter
VLAAALAFLLLRPQPLWSGTLASLSPVSAREQALDGELRRDLGAPDVRYLVVVHGPDEQAALRASEDAAAALRDAVARGWLLGFESPADYLPSEATQLARRTALPPSDVLRANLELARRGLPFKPDAFEPFVRDGPRRARCRCDRAALRGTSLGLRLDSLLVKRGKGWAAMLSAATDAHAIAGAIAAPPMPCCSISSSSSMIFIPLPARRAHQLARRRARSSSRCSRACACRAACSTS